MAVTPTRLVVGITTIPARLPHIGTAVASLLAQRHVGTVHVVLGLSQWSRKEHRPYDLAQLPAALAAHPRVHVEVLDDDYGPANKLLGAHRFCTARRWARDTAVAVADDDFVYPADAALHLLAARAALGQDACVSYAGQRVNVATGGVCQRLAVYGGTMARALDVVWAVPPRAATVAVDIVNGAAMFVVRAGALTDASLAAVRREAMASRAVRMSDDVALSAAMECDGVPRYVTAAPPSMSDTFAAQDLALPLSGNPLAFQDRLVAAAVRLHRQWGVFRGDAAWCPALPLRATMTLLVLGLAAFLACVAATAAWLWRRRQRQRRSNEAP